MIKVKDGIVKKITSPWTGKEIRHVTVDGEVYRWSWVYGTFNSVNGNKLLEQADIEKIVLPPVKLNWKRLTELTLIENFDELLTAMQALEITK